MPLFKRLPVLCVPLGSGAQSGMPHEPTATRSKFHAPSQAIYMSMPKEVAAFIEEAASYPRQERFGNSMRSNASEKIARFRGLTDCWLPVDRKKRIYVKSVADYRCFSRAWPCVHRSAA
jgi:hypothetical protein